jgi:prepilin-type N-terminal cleavage/methylation domain-containing protein
MKITQCKSKKQSGMTLMEMIASLSILAIVVVGALALFGGASSSQSSTAALRDLIAIRSGGQSLFIGQGSYGTTSMNQALITAKKVPSTMTVSGTTISTVWGGTVTVTGNTTNFTIQMTALTADVCAALVSNATTGWSSVTIGSTVMSTFPISPNVAGDSTHCGAAPVNVTWTTSS